MNPEPKLHIRLDPDHARELVELHDYGTKDDLSTSEKDAIAAFEKAVEDAFKPKMVNL